MTDPDRKLALTFSKTAMGLVLTVAVTAGITWLVQRALSKPRLHSNIIKLELTAEEGPFPLESVVSLSEFFEDNQEVQKALSKAVEAGLPLANPTDLRELLSGIAPDSNPVGNRDSISGTNSDALRSLLRLKDSLSGSIVMNFSAVRASLDKATAVLGKVQRARTELDSYLATHPKPDPQKTSEYAELFNRWDKDQDLTKYTPREPSPGAGATVWYGALVKTSENLKTVASVNDKEVAKLNDQLNANIKQAAQTRAFVVHALVVNNGDAPAAIFETGMLKTTPPAKGNPVNLVLSADGATGPLVIPARGHLLVTFRTSRQSSGTEADDWDAALKLFATPSATCVLNIISTDEDPSRSDPFPFYSGDTHRKRLVEALKLSG
jgi:hypothetical protein